MRDRPRVPLRDLAGLLAVSGCALLVVLPFGLLIVDLVQGGAAALGLPFLLESPADAGRAGGVGPVLASTIAVLAVALAVALPLALGAGVFLSEFAPRDGRMTAVLRGTSDLLASVPSVVYGLFGAAVFCDALGLGYSIASGGLTLACMILPFLARVTESALRDVPDDLRRAAAALGLTRTATVRRVVIPEALPGLAGGVVLAVGRAAAETAALIFTSGYVARWPESILDPGRTLSVHIHDLAMNVPGGEDRGRASALLLLVLLLSIDGAALWLLARRRRRDP